jgi:hypothetical protein
MHGDGGHAPEEIPLIAAPVAQSTADVSIGSRMEWLYHNSRRILGSGWLGAALRGRMPPAHFVGTEVTTLLQNLILGTHYNVFHSGFRAMSRQALLALNFEGFNREYLFDTEVLAAAHYGGLRVAEVPTTVFYDRRAGSSVQPISYTLKVVLYTYRLKQLYSKAHKTIHPPAEM